MKIYELIGWEIPVFIGIPLVMFIFLPAALVMAFVLVVIGVHYIAFEIRFALMRPKPTPIQEPSFQSKPVQINLSTNSNHKTLPDEDVQKRIEHIKSNQKEIKPLVPGEKAPII